MSWTKTTALTSRAGLSRRWPTHSLLKKMIADLMEMVQQLMLESAESASFYLMGTTTPEKWVQLRGMVCFPLWTASTLDRWSRRFPNTLWLMPVGTRAPTRLGCALVALA